MRPQSFSPLLLALLLAAASNAQAQQNPQQDLIIGDNVVPISGATITPQGNVEVECVGTCPGLGGGGSSGSPPNVSFSTTPTQLPNPIPVGGNARLWWTTNADVCVGKSATPANGASAWLKAYYNPANTNSSTGFDLNLLQRSSDNQSTEYALTLRCYEAASAGGSGTGDLAYRDLTRTVVLAGTGGSNPDPDPDPDPDPEGDFCAATYPAGHAARSKRGFQPPELARVDASFNALNSGVTFANVLAGLGKVDINLPAGFAGKNQYLAVAVDVPNISGHSQLTLSWVEPQTGGDVSNALVEFSVSPCPGDFRAATSSDPHTWDRTTCRRYAASGLMILSTDPNSGACLIPKGKRMYVNITTHNMPNYRTAQPGTAPLYNCPTGQVCGKRFNFQK